MLKHIIIGLGVGCLVIFGLFPLGILLAIGKLTFKNIKKIYYILFK
jgi:hypothetical protein